MREGWGCPNESTMLVLVNERDKVVDRGFLDTLRIDSTATAGCATQVESSQTADFEP